METAPAPNTSDSKQATSAIDDVKLDAVLYHVLTLIERDDVNAANERLSKHRRASPGPYGDVMREGVLSAAEVLVLDLCDGDALGDPNVAGVPGRNSCEYECVCWLCVIGYECVCLALGDWL
jgi:hypothetical protein